MEKIPLPGSARRERAGAHRVGAPPPDERFTISVILRPRSSGGERFPARPERRIMSREEYATLHGADPDDIAKIEAFAIEHNLAVTNVYPARRTVVLSGTVADFNRAFQIDLALYEAKGQQYRDRIGPIHLPPELVPLVQAVFGLDNRPLRRSITGGIAGSIGAKMSAGPFTPLQVAAAYNFPTGADGTGQTIGIIALASAKDGVGYLPLDITTNAAALKLPAPNVIDVSVDGTVSDPANPSGETTLDLEVASAIAPGATFVVYLANNDSDGLQSAISTAVTDLINAPSIISISFGSVEDPVDDGSEIAAIDGICQQAASHRVSILVASGDIGASDGEPDGMAHVDFPASSPNVTACGGTNILLLGSRIVNESAWNDSAGATGGGVSDHFDVPGYQVASGVLPVSNNPGHRIGRGVPDVAGSVGDYSGTFMGSAVDIPGGTSAVAPLWAGLVALINQIVGRNLGFLNPILYGRLGPLGALNDITVGNNGAYPVGYPAGPGWDACTGLGSPNGNKMVSLLGAPTVTGVSPSQGPVSGGTLVFITGNRFTGAQEAVFGNAPVPPLFDVMSENLIVVRGAPAATADMVSNGPVHVTVVRPDSTSTPTSADLFQYLFPIPAVTGIDPPGGGIGVPVTITGTGFTGVMNVIFGFFTLDQADIEFDSDTQLVVTSPFSIAIGPVHVRVITPGGTSAPTQTDTYTYQVN